MTDTGKPTEESAEATAAVESPTADSAAAEPDEPMQPQAL